MVSTGEKSGKKKKGGETVCRSNLRGANSPGKKTLSAGSERRKLKGERKK